jgi:hypothetical protein
MHSWAFAAPVLSGQEGVAAKEVPEHLRANMDQVNQSYEAHGITLDRTYVMPTPMGQFFIQYNEGTQPFQESINSFIHSDLEIDRYLLDMLAQIGGVDLATTEVEPPQQIFDYVDQQAPRTRGLTFVAPVETGRIEDLKAFFAEAGMRTEELTESRTFHGITMDRGYLNVSPEGNVLCVYLEGPDPVKGNESLAASTTPFDTWFKERAGEILGIDFNQPLPPIDQVWDWPANEG